MLSPHPNMFWSGAKFFLRRKTFFQSLEGTSFLENGNGISSIRNHLRKNVQFSFIISIFFSHPVSRIFIFSEITSAAWWWEAKQEISSIRNHLRRYVQFLIDILFIDIFLSHAASALSSRSLFSSLVMEGKQGISSIRNNLRWYVHLFLLIFCSE